MKEKKLIQVRDQTRVSLGSDVEEPTAGAETPGGRAWGSVQVSRGWGGPSLEQGFISIPHPVAESVSVWGFVFLSFLSF